MSRGSLVPMNAAAANAAVIGREIAWFQEVMTTRLTQHAGQGPDGDPATLVPAPSFLPTTARTATSSDASTWGRPSGCS